MGTQHQGVGQSSWSRQEGCCTGRLPGFLSPGSLAPPDSWVCSHILDLFAGLVPGCPLPVQASSTNSLCPIPKPSGMRWEHSRPQRRKAHNWTTPQL